MHPSRGSRVFYFTVRKLKLDYLPAGNSIDICPTFERKRQGQTFNYCSFSEGFAAKAASGVSSPCVNISAFSPVTQLVICLPRMLIHEARSLQKTQHEAPAGPPGPAQGSSTSTRPGGTELCGVAAGRGAEGVWGSCEDTWGVWRLWEVLPRSQRGQWDHRSLSLPLLAGTTLAGSLVCPRVPRRLAEQAVLSFWCWCSGLHGVTLCHPDPVTTHRSSTSALTNSPCPPSHCLLTFLNTWDIHHTVTILGALQRTAFFADL